MDQDKKNKAWILAVDMGYGHQRTAFGLRDLSINSIVNANNYLGIPKKDQLIWKSSRSFYEFFSNVKKIPLIGNLLFYVLIDKYQSISGYYPKRDLSGQSFNLKRVVGFIKRGWGEDLIKTLNGNPIPLISTFYVPAFMAEEFNYQGPIFCMVCDADIARSWAPLNPKDTIIKYFAPCNWVQDRLKLYGVPEENVYLTGYPLPKENIGSNEEIVKRDFAFRLLNLDPKREYYKKYHRIIEDYIGELPREADHYLTLMFSVGGAGAQKEIGAALIKSLKKKIQNRTLKLILSVGTRSEVKKYFLNQIKKLGMETEIGQGIEIVFNQNKGDYFREFNYKLRKTDILWTKPSELSFYAGLGLPIIIAPTIGSQEDFNKRWILHIGAGFLQENPKYADQWIFDLLEGGRLAEAAMDGFVEIEKKGAYNIEKIIESFQQNEKFF